MNRRWADAWVRPYARSYTFPVRAAHERQTARARRHGDRAGRKARARVMNRRWADAWVRHYAARAFPGARCTLAVTAEHIDTGTARAFQPARRIGTAARVSARAQSRRPTARLPSQDRCAVTSGRCASACRRRGTSGALPVGRAGTRCRRRCRRPSSSRLRRR